jgi:Flp pilus assembly protein TadG
MRLKRLHKCDSGATAVEAALSLLLLTTLIIGIVEFAFSYWLMNAMQSAVQQGARYALANHLISSGINAGTCQDPRTVSPTPQQVVASALPFASGTDKPFSTPVAACTRSCCTSDPQNPATITISVTYTNPVFNFIGLLTGNASAGLPTIGASATMPLI